MEQEQSIEIFIYKLVRNETLVADEWAGCIVAAPSERQAREIANGESGGEGYVWTDGGAVNAECVGIAYEGVQGVIASWLR